MYKFVLLSCVVAVASAGALIGGITPYAYSASYGYSPIAYSSYFYNPSNYRGPWSLAPGQPADILGSDGRPLDTLDVNLDRSAHLTAKALDGQHILKKRSVGATIFRSSLLPPRVIVTTFPKHGFHYPYAAAYAHW